jgi:hypothetical protein
LLAAVRGGRWGGRGGGGRDDNSIIGGHVAASHRSCWVTGIAAAVSGQQLGWATNIGRTVRHWRRPSPPAVGCRLPRSYSWVVGGGGRHHGRSLPSIVSHMAEINNSGTHAHVPVSTCGGLHVGKYAPPPAPAKNIGRRANLPLRGKTVKGGEKTRENWGYMKGKNAEKGQIWGIEVKRVK